MVSVGPCEQQLDMTLDVVRRKVNRTHDGFTAKLTTDEEIDDSFGVRLRSDRTKWIFLTITSDCPNLPEEICMENPCGRCVRSPFS